VIGRGRPSRALLALHLAALTGFAVAQPLFDVLALSPEFFVAHRASPGDIALVALLLLFGPPVAAMVVVLALDRMDRRAGTMAGLASVGILTVAFTLLALKKIGESPAVAAIGLAVAAGLVAAVLYYRAAAFRAFVTFLALGIVAFPVVFMQRPTIAALRHGPGASRAEVTPASRPVTVVFVVFDQFPLASLLDARGEIERAAYPAFAALGERSTWYRNATTVNPVTGWSVPAILTGRSPRTEDLPVASSHPNSLFTLLAPTHSLHSIEPITDICPDDLCAGPADPLAARAGAMLADLSVVYLHVVLPPSLTRTLPSVTQDWKNFAAGLNWQSRWAARDDERRDVPWDEFLAGIRRGAKPALHYAHVLLPHDPFVYLPSGARYTTEQIPPGLSDSYRWGNDEWLAAQGYQRHLLQAAFADTLLGRLLERLDREAMLDEALLVVASDHGAGFRPGGPLRNVDPQQFAAIMSVPLFIKRPLQRAGAIDDRNAETIDILPTVAQILGAKVPWAIDGTSLQSGQPRAAKVFSYERARVTRRFDPKTLLDGVLALAAEKERLFGKAEGAFRTPSIAPHAALVGQPIDAIPRAALPSGVGVRVQDAERYSKVRPESGLFPARLEGTASWTDGTERLALAIAVNGVVRATTRTSGSRPARWSAMIPPSALSAGSNRIDVYVITEGAAPALAPAFSTG
jgi:hypothetical protein